MAFDIYAHCARCSGPIYWLPLEGPVPPDTQHTSVFIRGKERMLHYRCFVEEWDGDQRRLVS